MANLLVPLDVYIIASTDARETRAARD